MPTSPSAEDDDDTAADQTLPTCNNSMSSEIRRRNPSSKSVPTDASPMVNYDEAHLSARALMRASPVLSGYACKMHIPLFYAVLPSSIQWLLSTRCCPKSWSPQWKRRYLIALGGYLYRFKDENGSTPKGAPMPVDSMEARLLSRDEAVANGEFNIVTDHLPGDCTSVIEVCSGGKTQYFAMNSTEEASTWVNSVRQMRQDCSTKNMGHSNIPYPKEWDAFDASAKRIREQKARIRNKLEAIDRKEQEMQTLGSAPSVGYYS